MMHRELRYWSLKLNNIWIPNHQILAKYRVDVGSSILI